jgi:hypothetical protein
MVFNIVDFPEETQPTKHTFKLSIGNSIK